MVFLKYQNYTSHERMFYWHPYCFHISGNLLLEWNVHGPLSSWGHYLTKEVIIFQNVPLTYKHSIQVLVINSNNTLTQTKELCIKIKILQLTGYPKRGWEHALHVNRTYIKTPTFAFQCHYWCVEKGWKIGF